MTLMRLWFVLKLTHLHLRCFDGVNQIVSEMFLKSCRKSRYYEYFETIVTESIGK